MLATTGTASAMVGAPYVRYGATGDPALCVQAGIGAMDNSTIWTYPDGQFGPDTLRAVKQFQAYFGLEQDGVVGPATGTKLMEMIYLDIQRTGVLAYDWCYRFLPTYK
ncbi:peptidoglycan-binding domain-containing protein [Kitasatospora sp. NPDC054939]